MKQLCWVRLNGVFQWQRSRRTSVWQQPWSDCSSVQNTKTTASAAHTQEKITEQTANCVCACGPYHSGAEILVLCRTPSHPARSRLWARWVCCAGGAAGGIAGPLGVGHRCTGAADGGCSCASVSSPPPCCRWHFTVPLVFIETFHATMLGCRCPEEEWAPLLLPLLSVKPRQLS